MATFMDVFWYCFAGAAGLFSVLFIFIAALELGKGVKVVCDDFRFWWKYNRRKSEKVSHK